MKCTGKLSDGSECGCDNVYKCDCDACGAVGCETKGCSNYLWEGDKCVKCGMSGHKAKV